MLTLEVLRDCLRSRQSFWIWLSVIHPPLWNENVIILMIFSSLAALKVVKMTTFSTANDENLIKKTNILVSMQSCVGFVSVQCSWSQVFSRYCELLMDVDIHTYLYFPSRWVLILSGHGRTIVRQVYQSVKMFCVNMTSWYWYIFCITDSLWGESTNQNPLTKGQ